MSSLPPPSFGGSNPPPPPPPSSFAGYPSYGHAAVPVTYKSIGSVSKALFILLLIESAMHVMQIPVLIAMHGQAQDFIDGTISEDTFRGVYLRQAALGFPAAGVSIAVRVLAIIWMYKLAQNNDALGRPTRRWSTGWAIASWFVPPGFVYAVPWLMLRELWKGSDPQNVANDKNWRSRSVSPLLQVWWVLYGLVPLLGVFAGVATVFDFNTSSLDNAAERATDWFVLDIVLAGAAFAGCAVFALIVRELTQRQQHLTEAA